MNSSQNAGGFGGGGTSPPIFSILVAGSWNIANATDSVLLDFDQRFRRRILLHTSGGREILLDLPKAARLRQDDGLVLPDGGVVRVCARPEPLLEVSAPHDLLMRAAWHLGNRHLPVQFAGGVLRIRTDHVIASMLEGLGCAVRAVEAPFDPEAGAYAEGGGHHDHTDDDARHGRHQHG